LHLTVVRCTVCAKARGWGEGSAGPGRCGWGLVKTISPNTEKVLAGHGNPNISIRCRRATRLPLSSISIALCHAVSADIIPKVGEKSWTQHQRLAAIPALTEHLEVHSFSAIIIGIVVSSSSIMAVGLRMKTYF
jgi:hypothetical protein